MILAAVGHMGCHAEIPKTYENAKIDPKAQKTQKMPMIGHNVTMVLDVKWTEL